MKRNSLVVVLGLFAASIAFASNQDGDFKARSTTLEPNLLTESQTINLQAEPLIQQKSTPSKLALTFLGGATSPGGLTVNTYGHRVQYGFDTPIPLMTAEMTYSLLQTTQGKVELGASVGYSYSTYQATSPVALHVMPVMASVGYRREITGQEKFIPYVKMGPALWNYYQRGIDQYNATGSAVTAQATAGVAANLNTLGLLKSRNTLELVLQYQRNFLSQTAENNWDGNTVELGGRLAL